MKRIQSKLLVVLALSIPGAFSLQGMQGQGDSGYLDLLGNPHAFGALSLQQKNKDDYAKHKKQKEAAANNRPKKVRSLIDVLPANFKRIPGAVWTDQVAPLLGQSKQLLPVSIKPIKNRLVAGGLWLLFCSEQDVIRLVDSAREITPDDLQSIVPGLHSQDGRIIVSSKDGRLKVINAVSGNIVGDFADRVNEDGFPLENFHLSKTGRFLFLTTIEQNIPQGVAGLRCIDLASENKTFWEIEESLGWHELSSSEALLALQARDNHVRVYDMNTKKLLFQTDGSSFRLHPDGGFIAVQHYDRVKIFDLNDKQHKELLDVPGRNIAGMWHDKIIVGEGDAEGTIRVYDIKSKAELIKLKGRIEGLSSDGKFIAVASHPDEAFKYFNVYDIASNDKMFKENVTYERYTITFSPDSRYLVYSETEKAVLIDLNTKERYEFQAGKPCFSPDWRFCALTQIKQIPEDKAHPYVVSTSVIDLKTKREVARHESEKNPYIYISPELENVSNFFSFDNRMLYITKFFPSQSYRKIWKLDLSSLQDKKFNDASTNKFTPEQSALLMLLDEAQKKNGDKPLSFLHDIALKKMLSLKELQATLANFHPLIAQSIIERYKIIDPTPEAYKQHKVQKTLDNKKYWANIIKATGFIGLVATLVAKWYFKKR